jgi:hypothetical protein
VASPLEQKQLGPHTGVGYAPASSHARLNCAAEYPHAHLLTQRVGRIVSPTRVDGPPFVLVEHDSDLRDGYARALRAAGFNSIDAADAAQALICVSTSEPALIFTAYALGSSL